MLVCVDPGHGGIETGAKGPGGILEKVINLLAGHQLKQALLAAKQHVVLTRLTDIDVSLSSRADIANWAGADVFVSLHCNSAADPSAKGIEVYHHPKASPKAKSLAADIQKRLVAATGLVDRGVKAANFAVLRRTTMPAVLVEMAFISNPAEEALLLKEEWRGMVVREIAAAVIAL